MSRVLAFWVEGTPVPKQRARVVRARGKVVSFTPKRTSRWEQAVRLVAQAACSAVQWKPTPAAYQVTIRVQRAARRGDADNFAKSVLDSMNGVVFPDDSAVHSLSVSIVDGETPGVDVRVTRDEAGEPREAA